MEITCIWNDTTVDFKQKRKKPFENVTETIKSCVSFYQDKSK